jgi:hypothetical protein
MNLNGGLGAITIKNQILLSDSLNFGKITACKHANGQDWWIICQRLYSNKFYKFLLTPGGLSSPSSQLIGNTFRKAGAGQAYFSPDGNKYAHFWVNEGVPKWGRLELFDFDRCSGTLSNALIDSVIPFNNGTQVGLSFSPNSELLYVFNMMHVFQYDLASANIMSSRDTVATYDGFLSTYPGWPGFATLFCLGAPAPDGKIYITSGNGTLHMHTIDNPDVLGVGCNVSQHSVQLPAYYFNTLPNHPNYFLGCDTTSTCTCLTGESVMYHGGEIAVSVTPNPNDGIFTLKFPVSSRSGAVEIYDVNGSLVHKEAVAAWSQFKKIDISFSSPGIYFCKLRWKNREGNARIIIQ